MRALRSERGNALITAVLVVAMMAGLGLAMVSVIDAQTKQTSVQRSSETASDLAEAALNAGVALLARNWPQPGSSPCSGQTMTGTLAPPADTTTLGDQVQNILAQTYADSTTTTGAKWWLNVCHWNNRDAWDSSLLSANNPTVATNPHKLWVRAEAQVGGRRRAVVGLVQATQQSVFPELGVVTGKLGDDLGPAFSNIGSMQPSFGIPQLLKSLTGVLINRQPPMIEGDVGLLNCNPMLANELANCLLPGVLKDTSAKSAAIGSLAQRNDFVNFNSDSGSTISADQLSLLRQQAKQTGTYSATVNDKDLCLPRAGSPGNIVFIEQVGDGTGSCRVDTSGNPFAKALIVGAGGVQVCADVFTFFGVSTCQPTPRGTFTGVIYALHRKVPKLADVEIRDGAKVAGGVYVDIAPDGSSRGTLEIIPPPPDTSKPNHTPVGDLATSCWVLPGTCDLLVSDIASQLAPYFPAVQYKDNEAVVRSVTTFGDAAIVPGTFRQVAPSH